MTKKYHTAKNVDIKFSAQGAFMNCHSSGTSKSKGWKTKLFKKLKQFQN